ncbi:hypothetical protein RPIT_03835 [Tessaracoccus flavus]|uniref:N,N-dimethylformamidase beta subunit-like C-terminal domain-containing protein n=1 Tax=Tessaracoccus flavus TaxID=1610493 RepID=A0A1Q2CD51_9ACTN|nr:hypothetical protein RPIT_03835 [Tessaracoccus flavus]
MEEQATDSALSGFHGAESVLAGDTVALRVHSPGQPVAIDVYRIGHYGGTGGRLVAQIPSQAGTDQPPCTVEADYMVDCSAWSVTHSIDTAGWQPGVYFFNLRHPSGLRKTVPVILRSASHAGTVTIMSGTATHQAYNPTGGSSLYQGVDGDGRISWDHRSRRVTFNRPFASQGTGRVQKILNYEVGLIHHLDSLGVPLSYTTNFALHRDGAGQYAGSPAMVFLGHDEYWSVEMRTAVEKLRDSGTNLLFLGGNTAYWRIRWNDDGTVITSYKDAAEDPVQNSRDTTTLWRSPPAAAPEASLLGGQYVCASPSYVAAPLVVTDPGFWGFAGLGVRAGSQFPGLVGHEIDQVAAASPSTTSVVASSPLQCKNMMGRSDLTYYTAPSGAGVVNVATFGFAWAVSPWIDVAPAESRAFARGFLRNLVVEAAKGPLALRFPSTPDLEKRPELVYVTPGEHLVNGRRWRTVCEAYSQTERCRTEIWATTVRPSGTGFIRSTGWVFNNLTYKPLPRSVWQGNPLARTGTWVSAEGRQWRSECDTPATGRNACRNYLRADVVGPRRDGTAGYEWQRQVWLFNSLVLFR